MSLMKQRISLKRTGTFSARTATIALLNAPAKVSTEGASKCGLGKGMWNRAAMGGDAWGWRDPWEAACLLLVLLCV